MTTELTLEEIEKIKQRRREWGGGLCLNIDDLNKLLTAARAGVEAREWRTIESAPKDGTFILLCRKNPFWPSAWKWDDDVWVRDHMFWPNR